MSDRLNLTDSEPICMLRLLQSDLKYMHPATTGVPAGKNRRGILSQLVTPHGRVHFLRPAVNPAAQTADRLQAMSHEISGGIQTIFAVMVNDDNRTFVRAAG